MLQIMWAIVLNHLLYHCSDYPWCPVRDDDGQGHKISWVSCLLYR